MFRIAGVLLALAGIAVLVATSLPVRAEAPDRRLARDVVRPGTELMLGTSMLMPLLRDGNQGLLHSARTGDVLLTGYLLERGLKSVTRVGHTPGGNTMQFPSGHATAVFGVATLEADWHPDEAPYWYAGASLVGVSLMRTNDHRFPEVLAGAALGYGVARLELSSPRGLLIAPFVSPGARGGGLQLAARF